MGVKGRVDVAILNVNVRKVNSMQTNLNGNS